MKEELQERGVVIVPVMSEDFAYEARLQSLKQELNNAKVRAGRKKSC